MGPSVFSHLDLKQFFLAPAKEEQLHRETGMRDGDKQTLYGIKIEEV
jgi:hypothetical protein